ncbi:MAG: 50S ribosomal protein L17 [Candidatus Berkelbacteria bacterium]
MIRKLGRKADDRNHLMRNLATSLLLYEVIETTEAKAKSLKGYVERILARTKNVDFNTSRYLNSILFDRNATKKVVDELSKRYESRNSGFVRSFRLNPRKGDNAPMMRLELVDKKVFVAEKVEVKDEKETKKVEKVEKTDKKVKDVSVKVKTKSKKNESN